MKWFKRLFGTRTKQESQGTAPTRTAEPAVTPAEVVEKASADEPTEKSADKPVEKPAAETSAETSVETSTETSAEAPAGNPVMPAVETPSEPAVKADAEATAEDIADAGDSTDPAMSRLDDERAKEELVTVDEPVPAETAVEPAEAPVVEKPAAVRKPAKKPAAATVAEPVAASAGEGPFGPGSAKPLADGAAPGDEYTVKGKRSSKLFHTAESPYFGRTKADVWFKTPADAENAGFAAWNHKKKAAAK